MLSALARLKPSDCDSNVFDVERLEIAAREVMNVGQSDEFRHCIPLCRS